MERKIGEIFEYNGEWYQCVNGFECTKCDLHQNKRCTARYNDIGSCSKYSRKGNTPVIFKKLEKVGEPYDFQKRTFQTYKLHTTPFLSEDVELVAIPSKDNNTIEIEIKEDMGKYRRHDAKKDIPDKEKPNLKPFNLEQAKAGKPVCTRDGRKARIICFDKGGEQPIVALIEKNEEESIDTFFNNGHSVSKTNEVAGDLMMLPEKKEGWVNIYYEHDAPSHREASWVYDKEEEAIKVGKEHGSCYIATVRIEWEE